MTSAPEFVDVANVASENIVVKVDPDDMMMEQVAPDLTLRDHNYTTPYMESSTDKPPTENASKPKDGSKPKVTKLKATYKCKICGFTTMNKALKEGHKEMHRNAKTANLPGKIQVKNIRSLDDSLQCPHCSFRTKKASGLTIHMRIHTLGKSFNCTECKFVGKDIKDLINHYKIAKQFCDQCTFTCHLKSKFEAHLKLHATKSKVVVVKKKKNAKKQTRDEERGEV